MAIHLDKNGNVIEAIIDGVRYSTEEYKAHEAAKKAAYLGAAKKDKIAVAVSQGNAIIKKVLEFIEERELEPTLFINNGKNTQLLYNWAKEKKAQILFKPYNWKGGLKAAFQNNQEIIDTAVKADAKVYIFWDGSDIVVKDMYIKCLNQKVRHEAILINEEDELVRCDDFIDALYHMRNQLVGEDPDGTLYSEVNAALKQVFLGWATPDALKEIERHLMTFGLYLDIGFNTGWSIDDEEAGGHLVEESKYDGYGFDEAYV